MLGVVALVAGQARVLQVEDAGDHPVQEVAVVRHDQQGAIELLEECLQPRQPFEVQVVPRFVQHEERGPQQHGLRK